MFNNGMNNCPKRQVCEQVIEPTQTKCIEKEFYHEIPQDCPFMIENK